MIIKKYIVSDMKEALVRAKYELGGEAVIISQRMVKTGKWFNLFKKKGLEVTVAIEENMDTNKQPQQETTTEVEDIEVIKPSEIIIGNNIVNVERSSSDSSFIYDIEQDPFYSNCSDRLKEQLVNYCKLHDKNNHYLSLQEKKDFFKIVLKQSNIVKRVDLCKINVLIGPTGVGKTTTIAKIAARESLVNKRKVGLITMDTYRIGAVEQLKTYANILGIPCEVVNGPEDMVEKINILSYCDVILIDTLGTSPKDLNKIEEIKKNLLAVNGQMNTYLVLSISTDKNTIMSILEKYKALRYDALIITKLDEVNDIGNLWYFLENNLVPIQFFCHGQDVPDDIQEATIDNLFEYCEENFQYAGSSK